jgi:hypothetical protein
MLEEVLTNVASIIWMISNQTEDDTWSLVNDTSFHEELEVVSEILY